MTEPILAVRTVCIDCSDAHEMARFYGGLLGWEPTIVEPDWVLMRNPAGGTGLSFQADPAYEPPTWPEVPGRQQKMLHLDVRVTAADASLNDGDSSEEADQAALDTAAELAISAGGRLAESQPREDLRIILDPAGHPLCLFHD
jgi:catechol 2,3-dioxygenase-like lactoylglutathione lyase family enzyme